MSENQEILAKRAYIEYTKLQKLREDVGGLAWEKDAISLSAQRYNEILNISKEALSQDIELSKSIDGLKPLEKFPRDCTQDYMGSWPNKVKEIVIDSGILLSALASFIRWYLPVEKQRTIGFRSEEQR
jgi:hypothetical protein